MTITKIMNYSMTFWTGLKSVPFGTSSSENWIPLPLWVRSMSASLLEPQEGVVGQQSLDL